MLLEHLSTLSDITERYDIILALKMHYFFPEVKKPPRRKSRWGAEVPKVWDLGSFSGAEVRRHGVGVAGAEVPEVWGLGLFPTWR